MAAAKGSSGVAIASITGSSAVNFRQTSTEQGSTIPNATALSPTAPLPSTSVKHLKRIEAAGLPGLIPSEVEVVLPAALSRSAPAGVLRSRRVLWFVGTLLVVALAILAAVLMTGR